jgi:chorismate mutase/prephenate dehydratase
MKNGDDLHRRRKQIDLLDSELLRLLNQRAKIACELASIKKSCGLEVYDGRREQQILDRLCTENPGPLEAEALISIFRCIISESRKLEETSMQQLEKITVSSHEFRAVDSNKKHELSS